MYAGMCRDWAGPRPAVEGTGSSGSEIGCRSSPSATLLHGEALQEGIVYVSCKVYHRLAKSHDVCLTSATPPPSLTGRVRSAVLRTAAYAGEGCWRRAPSWRPQVRAGVDRGLGLQRRLRRSVCSRIARRGAAD